MTDQSHTPLPWQACGMWVCEENDPGHNIGICVCEDRATEAETLANAALIVRSVNSVPSLVKALEFFANPENWLRDAACDPNSSNFRGINVALDALSSYRGEGK